VNLAEASRQYQASLEYERAMRTAVGGLASFDDDLAEAHADTLRAHAQIFEAMYARGH
jgi:hypothetical protein